MKNGDQKDPKSLWVAICLILRCAFSIPGTHLRQPNYDSQTSVPAHRGSTRQRFCLLISRHLLSIPESLAGPVWKPEYAGAIYMLSANKMKGELKIPNLLTSVISGTYAECTAIWRRRKHQPRVPPRSITTSPSIGCSGTIHLKTRVLLLGA